MKTRKLVLNSQDDRPIWRMPDTVPVQLAAALPADWQLETVQAPVSSRGDGGSVSAEAIAAARGAEIYIGAGVPQPVFLAAQPTLRWAHSTTAGISSFLYPEMVQSDVAFTNSAGIHAPPMAETVLAMMLHFARGLDFAIRSQRAGEWDQEPYIEGDAPVREIAGSRLTVVGAGGIAHEIEQRARPLGIEVTLLDSKTTRAQFEQALRGTDYLVLAVPDTPKTRGMIGPTELDLLQRGTVLINVARGSVVDEKALVAALQAGRLRGAGLDVFSTEPLPADSPLWRLPNVLITPHVSAVTRSFWDRQLKLILENLRAYLTGQPLHNLVDKQRGY